MRIVYAKKLRAGFSLCMCTYCAQDFVSSWTHNFLFDVLVPSDEMIGNMSRAFKDPLP